MPQIRSDALGRLDAHTPARPRSTVGSQTCGCCPVNAAAPLVSSTTPPSAVVSRSVGMALLQAIVGFPPSRPVPSQDRISPRPYRRVVALSAAHDGYASASALYGCTSTGGS